MSLSLVFCAQFAVHVFDRGGRAQISLEGLASGVRTRLLSIVRHRFPIGPNAVIIELSLTVFAQRYEETLEIDVAKVPFTPQ